VRHTCESVFNRLFKRHFWQNPGTCHKQNGFVYVKEQAYSLQEIAGLIEGNWLAPAFKPVTQKP